MIEIFDNVTEDHVAELIASEMKTVHWKYDYSSNRAVSPSRHWHVLCGHNSTEIISNGFEWVMPIWTSAMYKYKLKENFNVNYAIQGSVQSFGNTNRLTLELNDYSKNKVIWSDKLDFKLDDIFKVQDEIGTKILGELQVNVVVGQQAKRWMEEFDKYEKYTSCFF